MINHIKLLILCTGLLCFLSCRKKTEVNFEKVFQFSLEHTINTRLVPNVYAVKTLKIIKPKGLALAKSFSVNGKKCEILPENTSISVLLKNYDVFDPIPVVQVSSYTVNNDKISIGMMFKATGHFITLELKQEDNHQFKVISFQDVTL